MGRHRWCRFWALALALSLLGWSGVRPVPARAQGMPPHIILVLMENYSAPQVLSNSYFAGLCQQYACAMNYSGVTNPSLPNYLALTSGQWANLSGNHDHVSTAPYHVVNLFGQLQSAGISWGAYAEDWPAYPMTDYTSSENLYINDGTGAYVGHHFPVVYYTDIVTDASAYAHIADYTAIESLLTGPESGMPDFMWVTPNLIDDMHNSSVAAGATWLQSFLRDVQVSAIWPGSTVIVTWDNSPTSNGTLPDFEQAPSTDASGGNVLTLVISAHVKPGTQYTEVLSHYSLLQTIEDAYGLTPPGYAATAAAWPELAALLQSHGLPTCQGAVTAGVVDSSPNRAELDLGGGAWKVIATGLGGSGSVGIAQFSTSGCLSAWLAPVQPTSIVPPTASPPTYTGLELSYCGWGDFPLDWGVTGPTVPQQTYDSSTGCVSATVTSATDPPLSAFVLP